MLSFRTRAFSLLLILLSTFFPLQASNASVDFLDIKGYKYQDSIEYLAQKGVIQGHPEGNFGPNDSLNRAEMLKILLEVKFKGQIPEGQNCFEDVHEEWFSKYVCKAKEESIVKGYPDGFFRPGQAVNMAEALKMGIDTFGLTLAPSEDSEWFRPYVEFAHESSLFSKHSYLPGHSMTRGEMSFLVHQLLLNQEGTKLLSKQAQFWSEGCGKTPPSTPPTRSVVGGTERSYITVIPSDYNQNKPKKLIFAFHGRTNSNAQVKAYYGIDQAAGNEAILVYPSALPTNTSPRNWQDAGDKASNLRDYAFFDQLLKEFSTNYCVDLDEVYVVGHSLGAWFTNSLACFRGDVIRGVGTLGGGTSIGACTGPVATMIWHNPDDNLAPFKTGEQARDQYVRQNQCNQKTLPVAPATGNCVEYQGCHEGAPLIWCPHTIDTDERGAYYPHTWPKETGGDIWNFFTALKD